MQSRPRASARTTSARSWVDDPRLMLGLLGGLGVGEAIVAFAFSMPLGLGLAAGTGGLAVVGKVKERAAGRGASPRVAMNAEIDGLYLDTETGLPNRNQLLDQVAREIARAERYNYDLSLAVIEIERMDDIEAAWGTDAVTKAVAHAAQTLKRVTRTSDMLARVDRERFAVVLMQCSNEQAKKLAGRIELAVGNRPIRSGSRMRGVPVYLSVKVTTLQYDRTRLRGPLDFLSRAGGEMTVPQERKAARGHAPSRQLNVLATQAPALRKQLVRDYYPDGEIQDFAEAYKAFRTKAS